jgi:hypothetical protein
VAPSKMTPEGVKSAVIDALREAQRSESQRNLAELQNQGFGYAGSSY